MKVQLIVSNILFLRITAYSIDIPYLQIIQSSYQTDYGANKTVNKGEK